MSWICDYCSTANDDTVSECFVCGEPRSEASLREAKMRMAEERAQKRTALIYKWSTLSARILFISSTVVFSLVALIVLILKLSNGNVGDIVSILVGLGLRIGDNIVMTFRDNSVAIISSLSNSALLDIDDNVIYIFNNLYHVFAHLIAATVPGIIGKFGERGTYLVSYSSTVGNRFLLSYQWTVSELTHCYQSIVDSIDGIKAKIEFLVNKNANKISS